MDLKESCPTEVAECATAQDMADEPVFAWWAPCVLKKRKRTITAVNKQCHKTTHKFGFEMPKTVKRAWEMDQENDNALWQDATAKEMSTIGVAFKILDDGMDPPVGHQHVVLS